MNIFPSPQLKYKWNQQQDKKLSIHKMLVKWWRPLLSNLYQWHKSQTQMIDQGKGSKLLSENKWRILKVNLYQI